MPWHSSTEASSKRLWATIAKSRRLVPGLAEAHHDLANVLQTLGRLEEARDSYLETLRLDPERSATHANIAHVWEQLGEFDQSLKSLRETLLREPANAWALGRLAARLRGKLPETDHAAIDSLLTDPGLPDESRSQLLFGLVQVHDDRRDFDRAARLSIDANALRATTFASVDLAMTTMPITGPSTG